MIRRAAGDTVERQDASGSWVTCLLTSNRVKDDKGRWGYHTNDPEHNVKAFAYTSFVRTPKI